MDWNCLKTPVEANIWISSIGYGGNAKILWTFWVWFVVRAQSEQCHALPMTAFSSCGSTWPDLLLLAWSWTKLFRPILLNGTRSIGHQYIIGYAIVTRRLLQKSMTKVVSLVSVLDLFNIRNHLDVYITWYSWLSKGKCFRTWNHSAVHNSCRLKVYPRWIASAIHSEVIILQGK